MANAIADTTDYGPVLKTIWPRDEIADLFYDDSPAYAMVPKKTDWDGEIMAIPMQYGQTNGRSSKFDKAKKNKKASKFAKMSVQTSDNFSLFSVDHKTIVLSRNKRGAVVSALTRESRSAMKKLKRSIGFQFWRNGGGSIGKIKDIDDDTVILWDPRDARNFEEGDIVQVSDDDGTGGADVESGTAEVESVDTEAGTVTFTDTLTDTIATAANDQFLFIEGDYAAAFYGVSAYVTKSAPGEDDVPTTIWGMPRTAHKTRLSGVRVKGGGLLIEEAVKKALKEAKYEQGGVTHLFFSPDNFMDLELSLGTRLRYCDAKVGDVGFTGIRFTQHGGKPVECYQDPDVTTGDVWGLNMDTWVFHTAGEFPDFLTLSGQPNLRPEEDTNSFEGRIGGYGQMYCDAPGDNFYLNLNAAA